MTIGTPTNVMIMNPYLSLKDGELDLRLHEKSFAKAMDFVAANRARVRKIFIMADVPPFTTKAARIFKTKADARNRRGAFNLRHLGQFHPQIIEGYEPYLDDKKPEEILVLTESRIKQLISELPLKIHRQLPRCNTDGSMCGINTISCRAITAVGMNFCLTAGETNQLEVFIQPEETRTEPLTILDGAMDVSRIFGHEKEQLNLNFCK